MEYVKFELTLEECDALVHTVQMATAIMRVMSNEVPEKIDLVSLDSAVFKMIKMIETMEKYP